VPELLYNAYVPFFVFVCVCVCVSGLHKTRHTPRNTHTHMRLPGSVISPSKWPLPTQHKPNKRDENLCSQRNSNPQSQ